MYLQDLPLELLQQIFLDFVQVRSFKRAMRLRLVSRLFRDHVTEAIFRSRILDGVISPYDLRPAVAYYNPAWISFVQTYLAHRIFLEGDCGCPGSRIRLVAERICKLTGDTSDAALIAYIQNLCGLAFFDSTSRTRALIRLTPEGELSEHQFKAHLIDATVYLNLISLTNNLLSEGPSLDPRPSKTSIYGVLEKRLEVAAYHGSIEMIQLLLAAEPTLGNNAKLSSSLSSRILRYAAWGGHCDVFNFALDISEPYDLSDPHMSPYSSLSEAIWTTAFPDNYKRGVILFGSDSKVFSEESGGDMLPRVDASARFGRIEMVRYFLEQGVCLNNPDAKRNAVLDDGLKYRRSAYKPLLSAVERRNEAIVKLMLEYGADPNWYPLENTALMAAVDKNSLAIARMLVDNGAKVNDGSPPPIVLAVRNENIEIFQYLREMGAVLNTPETGAWAMAFAKFYGLDYMITLLVQEGVEEGAVLHRVPSLEEHCAASYVYSWIPALGRNGLS